MRVFILCCVCAALAPWLAYGSNGPRQVTNAPPWPRQFRGEVITEVPMTARERAFLEGFPGKVARFTDGQHDLLLRWVTRATRRLHPATDCYQAFGYDVADIRIVNDADGVQWRCFEASRDGEGRTVCEQIRDRDGHGWTDVSAWYWATLLDRSEGPWLVTTVASPTRSAGDQALQRPR